MLVKKHPTCSCVRSCQCDSPTPWERSTCYLINCLASPPSDWCRNGETLPPEIEFILLPGDKIYKSSVNKCVCKSCLLTSVCFIRYMQSFVELLDYENRKPEDSRALNEWVNIASINDSLMREQYMCSEYPICQPPSCCVLALCLQLIPLNTRTWISADCTGNGVYLYCNHAREINSHTTEKHRQESR